ncbi:D-alanyl-D-alanine carboxypeptidase/D-alanyl-D-alanine-endopeptidase [Rhodoferax sp. PAMC 29310]|uniref:D-alanyl-D-alanine carboxypeptidase/D-alanyl-D-alanine endopeptidase n=1 Tax=Rhodoferax sp. PAMC 29310 TaxID=2822760 RepID=UPI001B32D57B|nr:D-alanyl-D-alanine carboxypeptidase/D-alanyl-D-alanine-endopeptidase [Rhodoferax sp. PAMC 29310]
MNKPTTLLALLASGICSLSLAQALPPEVDAALSRAKVPREAVSLLVIEADGRTAPRLSHRALVPMNPASVMKLVTTYAALDLLGPAYTWQTPVYLGGPVRDGTLQGDLYIQGRGDPKLVAERLWLLLRRVQGLGIQKIAGDIVLDRSAFAIDDTDPGSFDGEPLRPYNATPDAFLVNFKSLVMTFVPDTGNNLARIQYEPPLGGVQLPASVPLSGGACNDYRATLQGDFNDATRVRFGGSFPAACGERVWPVAYVDPASYSARAVEGLWREMGGQLVGRVRDGRLPTAPGKTLKPVFEMSSPSLAEVVRDVNKYSNNIMAQHVLLSLSLPVRPAIGANPLPEQAPASTQASREVLLRWWKDRFGSDDLPVLDNGAGLSRDGRISAQALGRLLQTAYRSPLMPELMASLPISGIDGTLKRSKAQSQGTAHLKTGSLRDVTAVAGYVLANSGKRYIMVAMANHANAGAMRPAFDALQDWVVRDN